MVRALAPALERVVCTELPREALAARGRSGAASHPAAELAAACAEAGLAAEPRAAFPEALRRARALAAEPPGGVLLVTGSHYVLAPARAALGAAGGPERARGRGRDCARIRRWIEARAPNCSR